ncbi:MAG: hypothetical protein SPL73_04175 [Cyanobacteriota bacterium]|nr:hypothetical protein [Cyanobacteriota bacterium]MDY6358142.1 hypothetical protein [Cyanobacteriota bacterium]MDY6364068.1 hypothetical protein [Cyanobacteriota bacterium]MDY6383401.1 hypothetical protein [Cyanobacteriota bacterium]
MKNKIMIGIAAAIAVLVIIIGFICFLVHNNKNFIPGIAGLEKKNMAIIYCTQNDAIPQVINAVTKKAKFDVFQVKPAAPYPTDANAFQQRIKQENADLSKVVYETPRIKLRKYHFIAFATPLIDGNVCPVLKKYIKDHKYDFKNKSVSKIILTKPNENPQYANMFFYYELDKSFSKPGMVIDDTSAKNIEFVTNIWLGQMEFRRSEL